MSVPEEVIVELANATLKITKDEKGRGAVACVWWDENPPDEGPSYVIPVDDALMVVLPNLNLQRARRGG